jgi:hypothetical protein
MNNIGERGSPCLSPLLWVKGLPRQPLSRILEDDVARIRETKSRHLCSKPILVKTLRRKPQFRESKAFAMSSFRKTR